MTHIYIRGIYETLSLLDYQVVQRIIDAFQNCTYIDVFGDGSSLSSAYEFHNKMLRLGKRVFLEEGNSSQLYQALSCDKDHCAILISHSGENKDTLLCAEVLKKQQVFMIGLTAYPNSSLANLVNEKLITGSDEDKTLVTKLETFSSHASTHYILDYLYCCLYEKDYTINKKKTQDHERLIRVLRHQARK